MQESDDNQNHIRNKPDKKVVIIGDVSVGKSCLIKRYVDQVYTTTKMTIGTSFFVKQWNNKNIALWDTAGQEQYDGLRGFYCRGADAMILCYNISDRNSFKSLKTKYLKVFEQVSSGCLMVLVGTKYDLVNQTYQDHKDVVFRRTVTIDEAMDLYLEFKRLYNPMHHPSGTLPIFETSAKTGKNVNNVFEHIFDTLVPSSSSLEKSDTEGSGMVRLLERNLSGETNKDCCSVG